MKLIKEVLILSIVLSSIFSMKTKKNNLSSNNEQAGAAFGAAVLADPGKFADAAQKFAETLKTVSGIPLDFAVKLKDLRADLNRLRTDIGSATMINSTPKECRWRCKDEKSIWTHYLTIRGKSTMGPMTTVNISSSGTNPGLRCYVTCKGTNGKDESERGPYLLYRKAIYVWTEDGTKPFVNPN